MCRYPIRQTLLRWAMPLKAKFHIRWDLFEIIMWGRTFIRPDQSSRDEGVRHKFNPLKGFFEGKRIVLVDDSIVRGTTIRKIVRMIKGAGATEVHIRIGFAGGYTLLFLRD